MVQKISTIQEFINYHYGGTDVRKADVGLDTGTTGVLNRLYGAYAFSQLNNEANVFGLLPKYPWPRSGFRAITADAGETATGGVGETAALPDADIPTFAEIDINVKQVATRFEVSAIQNGLTKTDDAIGDVQFLRGYNATLHAKRINEQLCRDATDDVNVGFESVDRVTSSFAMVAAGLLDAGDEDIYDIDRSESSWADAVVSHNSGTDRTLTDQLLRDTLATIKTNGGRTNLIVTGNDTLHRIYGIYDTQVRYIGALNKNELIQIGVNGVMTEEGQGFGVKVATLYNIPLFASQAVQQDTISRIYLLDTTEQEGTGQPRLGIALLYPTMYFETGVNAGIPNPFVLDKFTTQGMFYTAGELVCTFFKAQGSIRDLK